MQLHKPLPFKLSISSLQIRQFAGKQDLAFTGECRRGLAGKLLREGAGRGGVLVQFVGEVLEEEGGTEADGWAIRWCGGRPFLAGLRRVGLVRGEGGVGFDAVVAFILMGLIVVVLSAVVSSVIAWSFVSLTAMSLASIASTTTMTVRAIHVELMLLC